VSLLEIVATKSEALQAAFAAQRKEIEKHVEVKTLDISALPGKDKARVFETLLAAPRKPDAILMRGLDDANLPYDFLPMVPLFLDHCTPLELGRTSPLRDAVRSAKRIYCYSQEVDTELRGTGVGRITIVSGPMFHGDTELPKNERPVVAVLNTSAESLPTLAKVLKMRKDQKWEFDIVSTVPHKDVIQVDMDLEATELADFVIAPYEDKDFGQPHEGAIMALAFRRPLTTVRTHAFNLMGFPAKNFIPATKYTLGSYGAAVGLYLRARPHYDEWGGKEIDSTELPRDLCGRL
jgi:hypothetical protein